MDRWMVAWTDGQVNEERETNRGTERQRQREDFSSLQETHPSFAIWTEAENSRWARDFTLS